jgi:hypothetical protein
MAPERWRAVYRKLADLFKENFEKFEGEVEVRRAGPQ